jgi:hypothetical protein
MHMLSVIGRQIIPNFAAANEPNTRPAVLHGLIPRSEPDASTRWSRLTRVLARRHPQMRFEPHEIPDPQDAPAARRIAEELLEAHRDEPWCLNATSGKKLPCAALIDLFRQRGQVVIYSGTRDSRILQLQPDWSARTLPFCEHLQLEDYFALFGCTTAVNDAVTGQERALVAQLRRLEGRAWSSVHLKSGEAVLGEYDAILIHHYRCFAFECKRLREGRQEGTQKRFPGDRTRQEKHTDIRMDLLKLYQVRQHFGGPFSRSYWVFSGDYQLSGQELETLKLFDVTLVSETQASALLRHATALGLPPVVGRDTVLQHPREATSG